MNRRLKKLMSLLKNNSGSSIVFVLITSMLIAIMGSMMLYASYTNITLKVSERHGKVNFYDADSVMVQIEAGLQSVVSNAISTANKEVLLMGVNQSSTHKQVTFSEEYKNAILGWSDEFTNAEGTDEVYNLFDSGIDPLNPNYTYNLEVLNMFIPGQATVTELNADGKIVITSGSDQIIIESTALSRVDLEYDDNGTPADASDDTELTSITLVGLMVTYNNAENNYTTSIETDMVLKVPSFSAGEVSYALSNLSNYSLIADNQLLLGTDGQSSDINLYGNTYAGLVNVSAPTTYSDGTMVLGGYDDAIGDTFPDESHPLVEIDGYTAPSDTIEGSLVISDSASLWTEEINLLENSSFTLNGAAYVSDDMSLGDSNTVIIDGVYTGYGITPDYYNDSSVAGRAGANISSSILVQGLDNKFTVPIGGVVKLAGNSFVTIGPDETVNNEYLMPESISIQSNQISYLVPPEYITISGETSSPATNPIYGNVTSANIDFNPNGVLWKDPNTGADVTIDYYCDDVKVINKQSNLTYVFFEFKSEELAEEYAEHYFRENKTIIEDRMGYYFESYSDYKTATGIIDIAGTMLKESGLDSYEMVAGEYNPTADDFADIEATYDRLQSPYSEVINTTKEGELKNTYDPEFVGRGDNLQVMINSSTTVENPVGLAYSTYITLNDYLFQNDSGTIVAVYNDDPNATLRISDYPDATYRYTDLNTGKIFEGTSLDVAVFISAGDIEIDVDNFEGLAIAAGNITVSATSVKTISADAIYVKQAFAAKARIYDGGTDSITLTELFSNDYAQGVNTGVESEDAVDDNELYNLVVYENWKKT